jgi:hypothetical protein
MLACNPALWHAARRWNVRALVAEERAEQPFQLRAKSGDHMKALLVAATLLSALFFTQAAEACTDIVKVSAAEPEHALKPGDCIASSNGRYRLTMQPDGVLTLSDERHPGHFVLWTANSGAAVQGSSAALKNDGSFVVADPSGKQLWHADARLPAGTAAGYRGDFFLILDNSARLQMYKGTSPFNLSSAVIWTSKGSATAEADVNGSCQCHIRNTDGSAGHLSGDAFPTCGYQACASICQSKKDYFGDALAGTYKNGGGKCKAF